MTVFALMWTDDTSPAWMLVWGVALVIIIFLCYIGLQSLPNWIAAYEDLDTLRTDQVATLEERAKRMKTIEKLREKLKSATSALAARRINVLFFFTVFASMGLGSLMDHIT